MQAITYTYKANNGLTIACELEYDPPDEHYPPAAFLIRALVAGVDISEVMSDKIIERIEEAAAWSMLE